MKNRRFQPYHAPALLLLLHIAAVSCSAESEGADFQLSASGSGAGAATGEAGSSNAGSNAGAAGDVSGAGEPGAAGAAGASGSAGSAGVSGSNAGAGAGGESAEAGAGGTDLCQPPAAVDTPVPEVCDNGLDDDLNGFVDEICPCAPGQTQPCFAGLPSQSSLPNCYLGTQTCTGVDEFPGWGPCEGSGCDDFVPPPEQCDDGLDNDCDGLVDEGCTLDVPVNIDGDCVNASCPPQAPFPSGCDIVMEGGDSRGCVANTPGQSLVYFQEGDKCPILGLPLGDVGHVGGTLFCSTELPAEPLNAGNCAINKAEPSYPPDPTGCAPVSF